MQQLKLRRKHPELAEPELMGLINEFNTKDSDSTSYISKTDVSTLLTSPKPWNTSGPFTYDNVREALKSVSDASGRVDLEDFAEIFSKLKLGAGTNGAGPSPVRGPPIPGRKPGLPPKPGQTAFGGGGAALGGVGAGAGAAAAGLGAGATGGKTTMGGSTGSSSHTINDDEKTEFTRHINSVLAGDADVGSRLPIPMDTMQIFDECRDGLILSKLINDSVPDTIDERVLNKPSSTRGHRHTPSVSISGTSSSLPKGLNTFQMTENHNIVIASCKAIGCSVVNIGPTDIIEGREHLILGLIWQIIRRGLLSKIDIKLHPELYRLLEEDETIEQFLKLPPDQILLRWFNYHLKNAGWGRRVNNFSKDVSDGENYAVLLAHLKPDVCTRAPLQERDLLRRAELVLQNADKIGCRKYLTPGSMVAGNPKLNLAFVAHLFNTWPCLEPLEEVERPVIDDFDAEGEREARVFTLWLNSLNVDPGVYNFFDDLRDGTVLLQAFDKVVPGSVTWRRVSRKPKPALDPESGEEYQPELSRFKQVENTNYFCDLAKTNRMTVVGTQGADIVDGTRTLVLGLVWQLMRKSVVATLASLGASSARGEIRDEDIVKWANETVKKAGKKTQMRGFKDGDLRTGVFYLDLLDSMKPGYVDYGLVTPGRNDEEAKANAKLAISIARKIGSLIFVVPEDIVESNARLRLTFFAALMATHMGLK